MRTLLGLFLLLFSLTALPLRAETGQQRAEAAGRGLVGSPAPRLVLKTIDGKTIDLASLYGKQAIYLKFWATWCVPCREQMPHLERTFEQAGPDLAVIAIDVGFDDTIADVRKYRDTVGLHMPIVFDDGTLGQAFNLRVTPQHIVIGRDGRIQYVGHMADAKLDAALLAARTASAPSVQGAVAAKDDPHYDVGDHVPAFTAPTLDGSVFKAQDTAVKGPTVLVFLSPWCESYLADSRPKVAASCRAVREQVTKLSRAGHTRWLGIASGLWASKDDLSGYRKEHQLSMPLTLDESGALFRQFRVMHVPTLLVVDAQGKIVRRIEGVDATLPTQLQALSAR
ncbi:TlpA family protein disulfide reductase [Dyella tabacisoli]|uniref:TlpA family protein disulfide reductase n=1 Tax=Dyella tabacisoli TaxID=2282381 RepID=A0A369UNQ7_9GAMM|nr:TlpA disulfide reductase family protein [Dyella tabacisoli]RDD82107.1 TlpA family protein disulfide reductase [Dyella tabacisoli]